MICTKGRYGPLVTEKIVVAVNEVLSVPFTPRSDPDALLHVHIMDDMIDLEEFLEVLIVEHSKALLIIDNLHDIVFKDSLHKKNIDSTESHTDSTEGPDLSLVGFARADTEYGEISVIQLRIYEMNELLHRFIDTDDDRNGLIDCTTFDTILSCLGQNSLISFAIKSFVKECKKGYSCGKNGSQISYIDIWAIMLSFLIQKIGSSVNLDDDLSLSSLPQMSLTAVREIKRGLEETQAKALVVYLGYMQCIVEDSGASIYDIIYEVGETSRDRGDSLSLQDDSKSIKGFPVEGDDGHHLPLQGVWSMNAVHASDSPGLLSVVKIIADNKLRKSDSVNVVPTHTSDQIIPLPTKTPAGRSQSTLSLLNREKPDLHPVNLILNVDVPQATNGLSSLNDRTFQSQGTNEFSSSHRSVSFENNNNYASHGLADNTVAFNNDGDGEGIEEVYEDEMNRVTCTEIERLRIAQLLRDHEMYGKLAAERELMARRRAKKQASLHSFHKFRKNNQIPKRRQPLAGYESAPQPAKKHSTPIPPLVIQREQESPHYGAAIECVVPPVQSMMESSQDDVPIMTAASVEAILPSVSMPLPEEEEEEELPGADSPFETETFSETASEPGTTRYIPS